MDSENPFAALLQETSNEKKPEENEKPSHSTVLEDIFGFTVIEEHAQKRGLVFLSDLSNVFPNRELDLELMEHALFERLFLEGRAQIDEALIYLYDCYCKTETLTETEWRERVKAIIMRDILTSLMQPDLYANQNVTEQLYKLLKADFGSKFGFVEDLYASFIKDEGPEALETPFKNLLNLIYEEIRTSSSATLNIYVINDILSFFATHKYLAELLINHKRSDKPFEHGIEYVNSILGALLNISILPKNPLEPCEFFTDVVDNASRASTEQVVWTKTHVLTKTVYNIFHLLLKHGAEVKKMTLQWFGDCLRSNADRAKLWNVHTPALNPSAYMTVNDGFMINLMTVLLHLSQPFCSDVKNNKILRVDPTYCAVSNEESSEKGVHLLDLHKETCLVPTDSQEENRLKGASFNFVTECFFMAHRAFYLGFKVAVDKLVALNQDLARIERTFNEAREGSNPTVVETIRDRMKTEMAKYLSVKAVLSEPNLLKMAYDYVSNTAFWLTQVVLNVNVEDGAAVFAPLEGRRLQLPLNIEVPETLKCIPEFVTENLICFVVFLRRFAPDVFEQEPYDHLEIILSFILIFVGSKERMRNPHVRAKLAEVLEALLPQHKDEPAGLNTLGAYQRTALFKNYPFRKEVICSLLKVFVQIEMTGESVEFEQKFNYRRPMYAVLDYLWEIEEYQQYLTELAEDTERNMEAVSPPLFLRFVNLLMNDAVFLLDEALTNMEKLREMQMARDNGEWDRLPAQERAQNMGFLQHTGMAARFDNILGRDTIRTLEHLTSNITIVFTHPTMVDRVAAMLNYFLFNLVGPKKKNLKVKDPEKYSFDPVETVLNICRIYVNLKESDSFCSAVSQDGRSYSPQLFKYAEDVLIRIGGAQLIGELQEVAHKVHLKAIEQQANEEVIAEAPEHFMDPIMSTLMLDPVTLPSSRQTVDRSTIARHLLSDQTDPFNRAPLSMDQVIPNVELAEEIRKWLEQRKSARNKE